MFCAFYQYFLHLQLESPHASSWGHDCLQVRPFRVKCVLFFFYSFWLRVLFRIFMLMPWFLLQGPGRDNRLLLTANRVAASFVSFFSLLFLFRYFDVIVFHTLVATTRRYSQVRLASGSQSGPILASVSQVARRYSQVSLMWLTSGSQILASVSQIFASVTQILVLADTRKWLASRKCS